MKKPSIKKLQKQCDNFNKKYPVDTEVFLEKDLVGPVITQVARPAFILGGHSAVAFFKGISGCYSIDCVMGKNTAK